MADQALFSVSGPAFLETSQPTHAVREGSPLPGFQPVIMVKVLQDGEGRLLRAACPGRLDESYFKQCMKEAVALGLTWIEGVQYVIQRRRELN